MGNRHRQPLSGSWFLVLSPSVGLWKEHRAGHQTTCIVLPALLLPANRYVTSGKWLRVSEARGLPVRASDLSSDGQHPVPGLPGTSACRCPLPQRPGPSLPSAPQSFLSEADISHYREPPGKGRVFRGAQKGIIHYSYLIPLVSKPRSEGTSTLCQALHVSACINVR